MRLFSCLFSKYTKLLKLLPNNSMDHNEAFLFILAYMSFKMRDIVCYNYGGTLGCQDNQEILMPIEDAG